MKKIAAFIMLAAVAFLLGGCLGVEKKEYHFTVNPDGSGSGVIRYVNLVSNDDNSGTDEAKNVSFKDFAELVSDYLEGTKFEEDHPYLKVTSKRLLEESGALVGEVTFTFASLDSVGFFRRAQCDCCPVLYFNKTETGDETVTETNGRLVEGVASSPFIEWEGNAREFVFKTTALSDLSGTRSMVEYYRTWKAKK
ncbi:MAG: hypothetical protein NT025_02190 [bacterium]|nr:hypothetical protein [bacterium]